MHCYFVLAGDSTIPILYHVERVRDGKSFVTRTVQARQKGRCIFTTTCSFMREGSEGAKAVAHGWELPEGVIDLLPDENGEDGTREGGGDDEESDAERNGLEKFGPFVSRRLGIVNSEFPLSF